MNRLCLVSFVFALGVVAPAAEVFASDHADPIKLRNLEAGLTGLFAFPDGDRLVLVLGTRRALQFGKPYDLEPFEFAIHMDLTSAVSYDNEEVVARYGGRVVDPAEIAATEVAFIEGGSPRRTTTDVPFLDEMPYLGRPWPDLPHEAHAGLWARRSALIVFLVLAVWLTLRYARYHNYQP
jgi:hypothetical protein